MNRIKTSPIWKITTAKLIEVIANCGSITEALLHFELKNKGSNFRTLKKRLIQDQIDYSHFDADAARSKSNLNRGLSLKDILIEGSCYSRGFLKLRLLREGLLENKCGICGQLPEWNGKPLTLQIDHINGVSDDHRIENLRILCGHCHSQTSNFAGKNKRKK